MNKVTKLTMKILMPFLLSLTFHSMVYASDGQEYITISVEATDDNDDTLLYALDTDDPGAFTSSNTFSVPAGTNHTIYVKDAAGNITTQEYIPSEADYDQAYQQGEDDEGRTVNIDVVLDDQPDNSDNSDYEYAGDLLYDPAEMGQGTVYDRIETQVNDTDAARLFYTVTTDDGEVFYLVIDQGQSNHNVYLLDQVNLSDLSALAVQDEKESTSEGTTSLLSALNGEKDSPGDETLLTEGGAEASDKKSGKSSFGSSIFMLMIIAAGGGIYYYIKVYRNKRDEQMDLIDAPDKDDFVASEEAEEEEVDFGLDEDYQEQTMAMLLEEDFNEPGEQIPDPDDIENENYAISHKNNSEETTEVAEEYEYDEDLDAPDEED